MTAVALATGLCASPSAHAAAQAVLNVRDPTQTPTSVGLNQTDPVLISRTLVNGGSIATAVADLSAGKLRATATSAQPIGPYTSQGDLTSASALALISDAFAFNAGANGMSYLDWRFQGQIAVDPDAPGTGPFSQANLSLTFFPARGGTTLSYSITLTNSTTCPAPPTVCVVGTSIDRIDSFAVPIIAGGYAMIASLSVVGRQGDAVDFYDTASLYLRLPENVSITSGSGAFLSQAMPVPEPPTLALALAGVLFMARLGRRRSA